MGIAHVDLYILVYVVLEYSFQGFILFYLIVRKIGISCELIAVRK